MNDLNAHLTNELQRLELELGELQEELRRGADRLALIKERITHVRALLGESAAPQKRHTPSATTTGTDDNTMRDPCDYVEEILIERGGEAVHYKELAEEVIRRGGVLGGVTPWSTLSARLVRDGRFVRPTARGFYALRRDYPTARNVGERMKGGRRRGGRAA